jgi:uncharacterized protein DUF6983
MQTIPIKSAPNQVLTVMLASQLTKIELNTSSDGLMYANIYLNDVAIVSGVTCQNLNRIIRDAYHGFAGDLAFYDTQGSSDPTYDGLGIRYELVYLTAAEVAAL